jgi:hypothetical protein
MTFLASRGLIICCNRLVDERLGFGDVNLNTDDAGYALFPVMQTGVHRR